MVEMNRGQRASRVGCGWRFVLLRIVSGDLLRMKTANSHAGFTLIEIMIVVVIVGVLASIAIPSYNEYVVKSKIAHAHSMLSTKRVQMEQFFQDNHIYFQAAAGAVPEINSPACLADNSQKYFNYSCNVTATAYTITATGKDEMTGFNFTVNQSNAKTSPFAGSPAGWAAHSPDNCWVIGKGGKC